MYQQVYFEDIVILLFKKSAAHKNELEVLVNNIIHFQISANQK